MGLCVRRTRLRKAVRGKAYNGENNEAQHKEKGRKIYYLSPGWGKGRNQKAIRFDGIKGGTHLLDTQNNRTAAPLKPQIQKKNSLRNKAVAKRRKGNKLHASGVVDIWWAEGQKSPSIVYKGKERY